MHCRKDALLAPGKWPQKRIENELLSSILWWHIFFLGMEPKTLSFSCLSFFLPHLHCARYYYLLCCFFPCGCHHLFLCLPVCLSHLNFFSFLPRQNSSTRVPEHLLGHHVRLADLVWVFEFLFSSFLFFLSWMNEWMPFQTVLCKNVKSDFLVLLFFSFLHLGWRFGMRLSGWKQKKE